MTDIKIYKGDRKGRIRAQLLGTLLMLLLLNGFQARSHEGPVAFVLIPSRHRGWKNVGPVGPVGKGITSRRTIRNGSTTKDTWPSSLDVCSKMEAEAVCFSLWNSTNSTNHSLAFVASSLRPWLVAMAETDIIISDACCPFERNIMELLWTHQVIAPKSSQVGYIAPPPHQGFHTLPSAASGVPGIRSVPIAARCRLTRKSKNSKSHSGHENQDIYIYRERELYIYIVV